jgi:hypothetical protein
MNRLFLVSALLLTACAPRVVVGPPPSYAAAPAEVLGFVAEVIAADNRAPGGWEVTPGEPSSGLLRAQARQPLPIRFGADAGESEVLTVSVAVAGHTNTATVYISTSPRATYLYEKITRALDARFRRE